MAYLFLLNFDVRKYIWLENVRSATGHRERRARQHCLWIKFVVFWKRDAVKYIEQGDFQRHFWMLDCAKCGSWWRGSGRMWRNRCEHWTWWQITTTTWEVTAKNAAMACLLITCKRAPTATPVSALRWNNRRTWVSYIRFEISHNICETPY